MRIPAFRIVVMLVILVNLILTIALISQLREVQQRVASLPADLATRGDVAMLRPLRIRQILRQNCVECHSTRRLGVTVSMEPAEIQRTVERMQNHPGADIPPAEFERITASLLVARCARCHGEETLNLMVLKTQPERIATIRRMAALPGSGVRADQVLAIAQAFEKLVDDSDPGGTDKNDNLPVVQPRHGGFPEILAATGGGRLCEPDDPKALAAAVADLLADPAAARELGERGREAVFERFSVARMAGENFSVSIGGAEKKVAHEDPRYSAVYEIDGPQVLTSPAWAKAVEDGRWPGEVRPFTHNRRHALYKVR